MVEFVVLYYITKRGWPMLPSVFVPRSVRTSRIPAGSFCIGIAEGARQDHVEKLLETVKKETGETVLFQVIGKRILFCDNGVTRDGKQKVEDCLKKLRAKKKFLPKGTILLNCEDVGAVEEQQEA